MSDIGEVLINGHVNDLSDNSVIGGQITYNDFTIPVDANGNFKFYLTEKNITKAKYEVGYMDWGSKADISVNIPLMNAITHTPLTEEIIELCKQGSPYIKFGNDNGKCIVISVGTHGGELASQAAGFKLINLLAEYGGEINGTLYIFPVLFPEATANNTRVFNGINLNSVANENGSISNSLIKFAQSVNASGLGDFHCTRHSNSDVGITCAMGSYSPTYESFLIADFIHNQTGYDEDIYDIAGDPYAGAIEDMANIQGIPSVTCEVLTNHRAIEYDSPEMSFNMMRSFLKYFGVDIDEIIKIPFNRADMDLTFSSPYNYLSSSLLINKDSFKVTSQITANPTSFIINYGGKYSVILKDINGQSITGKKVMFRLNGKNIATAVTTNNGVATLTLTANVLKPLKSGNKNLLIEFDGDANYTKVTKTVKLTINKEKSKIVASKKTFKKSQNVKKYTVYLKNSKGKAIPKISLILKVKGKTFKAKTNTKGKATFAIKKINKKGTYKAKITFNGNNYFDKASAKVNIKLK